ncbi:hypothetical protein [Bernardetia litoralis]|nr:hypothetical protein [Bernardetia litoralis]
MKINRLFLMLVALFVCQTLVAQRNVLDAYKELQKYDKNLDYYKLFKKGNDWKTTSNADYEMSATVDFKNGYIEIDDDGTGGGTVNVQVVLFRTIDKRELIGVTTHRIFDGDFAGATYDFWKSTDSGWKNVTKEVLPTNFNYTNFCTQKIANVDAGFEKDINYRILLPQHGTTAKLYLSDALMMKQSDCERNNIDKSECELVELLQNNSYEYVELIWDKDNTRFKLGKGIENKQ